MNIQDLERQMELLERAFDIASTQERMKLASTAHKIVCKLDEHRQPIPRRLQSIQKKLEREAFDDMFDNMPV